MRRRPRLPPAWRQCDTTRWPMRPGRSCGSARCRTGASDSKARTPSPCRTRGKRGSGRRAWSRSQVAEGELKGDVVIVYPRALHPLRKEEAHVEGVLVGADLRNAGKLVFEREAQHLRGLFRRRLLVYALESDEGSRAPALAKHAQHDGERRMDGQEGLQPLFEVGAAALGRVVQP